MSAASNAFQSSLALAFAVRHQVRFLFLDGIFYHGDARSGMHAARRHSYDFESHCYGTPYLSHAFMLRYTIFKFMNQCNKKLFVFGMSVLVLPVHVSDPSLLIANRLSLSLSLSLSLDSIYGISASDTHHILSLSIRGRDAVNRCRNEARF